MWPTPIVDKIVTSFTRLGGRVVLLTGPGTAAIPGKPAPENSWHDESDSEVEAALTAIQALDRTAQTVHLSPTPGTHPPAFPPYRADLLDEPQGPDGAQTAERSNALLEHLADQAARADAVIADLRPHHSGQANTDHLARTAARLLRTGGILTVLTHSDNSRGQLVDPTGPVVAACQNADLLYLQHIVVLLTPLRDGHVVIGPETTGTTGRPHPPTKDHNRPAPHRRIHADLLVFAQPHQHQAPPPPPAVPVPGTRASR
ncbi:hypothetical protein [Saccharopolyspora phatthalungensis]|uniref:Uncharacterized protein n=1 Tax=Saccharopolyspora phatthalungensis TaxID=664693 RepID=A0A840QE99_9PSEU|nr:hypothetical protein [Saccharopolyspora phatthalungensis]MBB5156805.1 hypothetical protein [Saccharopolyspora phatthalungensis]